MKINGLLQPEDIIPELAAGTKDQALLEMAAKLEERRPGLVRSEVYRVLQEREKLGSTGIGDGVAIPHGKMKQAEELVLVFGRSSNGVDLMRLTAGRRIFFFS